jgi:hypothetical protein
VDVFKFNNNPSTPTKMENGEIINDINNKMWIERYREVGEFKFSSSVSSGLKDKLPIGTFISHKDTREIMIVEDHEINESQGEEAIITVTGRSLESWLENRVLGANFPDSFHAAHGEYTEWPAPGLYSYNHMHHIKDYAWAQAIALFKEHVDPAFLKDDNDQFPYLDIVSITAGGRQAYRKLERGISVLEGIQTLLAVQNLGIRSQRPSTLNILTILGNTTLVIHSGFDRTDTISFSYDGGEILDADYFWSNRDFKNYAYISSKWVETWAESANTDVFHRRRYIWVDGSDLDADFDVEPGPTEIIPLVDDLIIRGQDELDKHNNTNLTKVNAIHQPLDSQYRIDFNCGDLVTVNGNYNDSLTMRVTEYVEVEDENGEQGYPTLVVEDV